ncbi:MAG TPA: hypothetical protein VG167_22735 [Verrucomicrobiae bacterium]|nr:hypothetical protein [Verrucomicrobiae bacterium]
MRTDELADKAQELKEQAQNWQETAKYQARRAGAAADEYVRENSWQSVAIALGVGCLIGLLLARRGD